MCRITARLYCRQSEPGDEEALTVMSDPIRHRRPAYNDDFRDRVVAIVFARQLSSSIDFTRARHQLPLGAIRRIAPAK